MADITFRIFGGTRPRPDNRSPSPLDRFVEQVNRETHGPTEELMNVLRVHRDVIARRATGLRRRA